MTPGHELGAVLGRFDSDNHRRRRIFAVAVPVGGVVACLDGLLLFIIVGGGSGRGGPVMLPGLICGLAIGTMICGVQQGWLSRARRDEAFTLYEGGFIHSYAGIS